MANHREGITADDTACYKRLTEFHERIEKLMAMYDSQSRTPRIDRTRWDEARTLYTELKNDLRGEYKRLSRSRTRQSGAEDRWLHGPVHHAFVALSAPTNHSPEKWFSCLFDARDDLSHMIYQMRDHYDIRDAQ